MTSVRHCPCRVPDYSVPSDDERSALFLVDRGAAVDGAVPVSGDTPLHLLAAGGPQDEWRGRLARRLLDAGADTDAQNKELR